MQALQENHLAIIKAQSSILFKEVKRSRQESPSISINELPLPLTLQKRCPLSENIHNTRIIDNFEVTILYLLDKDGLIQDSNRLGMYTMLITHNPLLLFCNLVFDTYIKRHASVVCPIS
jgi:hypothetical protein